MRLVTRGDADGLICAVLFRAAGIVDRMFQAHPKDMQDGTVEVGPDDVICNLPYHEGCGMWFDHHSSEDSSDRLPTSFRGRYGLAPSTARLVYEYLVVDHPQVKRHESLVDAVDRFDSARLTMDDVARPEPVMLLFFVLDPRTGLGYHHSYRISNKQLTDMMPDLLLKHTPAEVLELPDVTIRVDRYRAMENEARVVYGERTRVEGNVLVTDFRAVSEIPPANRFLVYTLPGADKTNISIRLSTVKGGGRVSIQVAHNIFNRTSKVDVGRLMVAYGGGGHRGVGTCQVPAEDFNRVFSEIMTACRG